MIPEVKLPVIRRAIIDLLAGIGGEQSDDTVTLLLVEQAHRVARRDVAEQMRWLGEAGLLHVETIGPFVVAQLLPDGEDVAAGRLQVDGVRIHRSSFASGTAR